MNCLEGCQAHSSPNFGARKGGVSPSLILLHYTAMETAQAALDRLCDPQFEVSAHFLIGADGALYQLVDPDCRAWHAGAGTWRGQGDINSHSIGIELDNVGNQPFTEALMQALENLLERLMRRYDIAPHNVIGHSDSAPGRKCDPGPWFDWSRLAEKSLTCQPRLEIHPEDQEVAWENFLRAAEQAGYTAPAPREDILASVRLRMGRAPYRAAAPDMADLRWLKHFAP